MQLDRTYYPFITQTEAQPNLRSSGHPALKTAKFLFELLKDVDRTTWPKVHKNTFYKAGLLLLQKDKNGAGEISSFECFQIARDLGHPYAHHALGLCALYGIGRNVSLTDAHGYFATAVKVDPADINGALSWYFLATCRENLPEFSESCAWHALQKALTLNNADPNWALDWIRLGFYAYRDDLVSQLQCFKSGLRLVEGGHRPIFAEAWFTLAIGYQTGCGIVQDLDEAAHCFHQALHLKPNLNAFYKAHSFLSIYYADRTKPAPDRTLFHYAEFIKWANQDEIDRLEHTLVSVYAQLTPTEIAPLVPVFKAYLDKQPDSPGVRLISIQLGNYYIIQQQDYSQGIYFLKKAVIKYDDLSSSEQKALSTAWLGIAWCYDHMKSSAYDKPRFDAYNKALEHNIRDKTYKPVCLRLAYYHRLGIGTPIDDYKAEACELIAERLSGVSPRLIMTSPYD